MPTAAENKAAVRREIVNRQVIADFVADYMHNNCRAWSIDTLLTRPNDAFMMALSVAVKSGKLKKADALPILKRLARWQEHHAATLDIVDEICRAALASRKRGELKIDSH